MDLAPKEVVYSNIKPSILPYSCTGIRLEYDFFERHNSVEITYQGIEQTFFRCNLSASTLHASSLLHSQTRLVDRLVRNFKIVVTVKNSSYWQDLKICLKMVWLIPLEYHLCIWSLINCRASMINNILQCHRYAGIAECTLPTRNQGKWSAFERDGLHQLRRTNFKATDIVACFLWSISGFGHHEGFHGR